MHRFVYLLLAYAALGGAVALAATPLPVDDARLAAAGIRRVEGRHLELLTDVAPSPAVDGLPALFDAAVPLWAKYFDIPPARVRDWRVRAFLIGDREKFATLGLLPAETELVHGYAAGSALWLFDQPTDYYRRHLLLHEGTHAFMIAFVGGTGPGWYAEGLAELLATHRGGAGGRGQGAGNEGGDKLSLGIMPRDRSEVPMLGRLKLVRDAIAAGKLRSLDEVLELDNRRQLDNEAYAWCWAAAQFLDGSPKYRGPFRGLAREVNAGDFNAVARRTLAADWNEVAAEWLAFATMLEHDYDFERTTIAFARGTPLAAGGARVVKLAADRGWQSSGVWLEAGQPYRIAARGRYEIAREAGAAWPCEPGGVTIEYHDGRPLGMLLGAVVPAETGRSGGFAAPLAVGTGATITPTASGTLYLRVNDSAARLAENRGTLTIKVEN